MIKKILNHSAKQLAILVGAFLIAFLMFLAVGVVRGQFQEPLLAPPLGDVSAPLNVGTAPQLKQTTPGNPCPVGMSLGPGQLCASIGANDFWVNSMGQWVSQLVGGACTPIEFNVGGTNTPYTPVSYTNPSATTASGIPKFYVAISVPSQCVASSCTILGFRYLDTPGAGAGIPDPTDNLEVFRAATLFQMEVAAGINPPQINWFWWTKFGANDNTSCESGKNGSLSGCDVILNMQNSPDMFIHDDVQATDAGFIEQATNQWNIKDADSQRYMRFYVCDA